MPSIEELYHPYESQAVAEPYMPDENEQKVLNQIYTWYIRDNNIKNQAWDVLDGRTVGQFWQDCNYDYNVVVLGEDQTNPVQPYPTGISRDKANSFISRLASQLLLPQIIAQNSDQQIDIVFSRAARSVLDWAHQNDGRPSTSGLSKNADYIHKLAIEGTVHVQDDVIIDEDNNIRLESNSVPNEEIFIPNYYQKDIQKQPHVVRVSEYLTYEEAETMFGDQENFKYVVSGHISTYLLNTEAFKQRPESIFKPEGCTITRAWWPVPRETLAKLKDEGIIDKGVKRAKFYNVAINGVLIFPFDNLMRYRDGYYPISKEVFETFSPNEFYWGNSVPNKARYEKKWLDGWRTLIRYKGKLSLTAPLINASGQAFTEDWAQPGAVIDMPDGVSADKIFKIPGVSDGINNSDMALLNEATAAANSATMDNQSQGMSSSGKKTARESVIIEENAQKSLFSFASHVYNLSSARAIPILSRLFQFIKYKQFYKIAVPNQKLEDGSFGNFYVLFHKIDTTIPESAPGVPGLSEQLYLQQQEMKANGENGEVIMIDKSYLDEIDMLCTSTAEAQITPSRASRAAEAEMKFSQYSMRPDLFNVKAAARKLVQAYGDDETEMIIDQPNPMLEQMMQGGGSAQNTKGPVLPTATNTSTLNSLNKRQGQLNADLLTNNFK